jgi:hypothetical protein
MTAAPNVPDTVPILLCPVCSSQLDPDGWGHQELDCSTCGTSMTVELDPEKVARHSIV